MTHQPQSFAAPDGTAMVILTAEEFRRLQRLASEQEDLADAKAELTSINDGSGVLPDQVMSLLVDGLSPVAAWRLHRGLTQSELADKLEVSQVRVSRLETGYQPISKGLCDRLAAALDAPAWAFEAETLAPVSPRARKKRALVRLLVGSNPKRPGSQAHARFSQYFTLDWSKPVTVQDCLNAGVRMDDIGWDVRHGFIAVE